MPVPLALRVLAWRLRPALLAVGLVALCTVAARLAAPPPPPSAPVVVARADLAPGHVLAAEDLRTVRLPARLAPPAAVADPDALVGARVAVPVPVGLPVVEAHLARSRFARQPPPGTVAVPVQPADDAVADLLRPGDRVDLVTAGDAWGGEAPRVLARAALVLDVVVADDDAAAGLLGAAGGGPSGAPVLVVAVSPGEGHALAAAGGGHIGAVLVQGS